MKHSFTPTRIIVGIASLAVALSSCSSGSTSAKSSTTETKPPGKEDSLADFFGGSDPAQQKARFERQERERETKVAKCMRDQGFEYTPYTQARGGQIFAQPKPGEEVAFKRKNGYGFANGMAESGKVQQNLNADPNQKRMEKMTESDRNAYQKALYGFDANKPPVSGQEFQPSGCANEGYAEQEKAFKPLNAKFEQLQKRTDADPEIAKLNSKFTSCMTKAGYAITKEQDIYEKVLGPEQNKVYEDAYKNSPSPDSAAVESQTIPTISPAKIDAFRKFELKVANADADCRSQKEVNKMAELRKNYEKAFIEENRALLEKLPR